MGGIPKSAVWVLLSHLHTECGQNNVDRARFDLWLFFFVQCCFLGARGVGGGGDVRDGVWRRRNGRRKREGTEFRNLGRFPQTTDFELF